MTTLFKIVFEGSPLPGVDLQTAKANLAQLFRSDLEAVEKLFTGHKVALKRNLSHDTAQKYLDALHKAGVQARLEEETPLELSLEEVEPLPEPAYSPYAPPQSDIAPTIAVYGPLKVMTIQGRIGRVRYLGWSMALLLCACLAALVCVTLLTLSKPLGIGAGAIAVAAFMTINVQIGVQRLHDAGWTGWMWLLNLVPFVGSIFPLVVMAVPGNPGTNQYGPPAPPNSTAVKVLAWLWVVFLVLMFFAGITGGLSSVAQHSAAL
ncbi:DUF805 domain-containing protein [Pseudomonas eucalypticola]|uniref:DUF805 domain-containing protein n=1 Tax=Pseudomonas eucalypticola TaxID=2599595 RepID=A0A7D5H343_9PSED|nr:DUF805 domain-containing protein [Pseudomonas eucalypticola]QKZ07047.1 DUF805 domain-containing protein [Pseudomonas eucalypticola]